MIAARAIVVATGLLAGAAAAAPSRAIVVPAGTLGAAIVAIGTQAGVSIGIADPALAAMPVRGVRGRIGAARALDRVLAGTGAAAVAIDAVTFRIVRRAPPPVPVAPRPHPVALRADPRGDIVVTGAKRSARREDYPGAIVQIDTADLRPGRLAQGSDALLALEPALSATHLGPGRNKLFIRGIADSSFNGPTEATVGQYLGETRINFNAPDPDLALYDLSAIEILEGPQGTLYGAGSLGGIVRLVPARPAFDAASLTLSLGGSATAHGAAGGDVAAIGNLPLIADTIAVRGLVYASRDGGYIDDPARGRRDINRTDTIGGRATVRIDPAPGWTIDLIGAVQDINSRDGQYAERGLPPLRRASVIAQPFDNDYGLASAIVRHTIGATELVSATSAVLHNFGSVFDASASAAVPRRYTERNAITLLTNETRLSHRDPRGGGWVIGVELLRNASRLARTLGPVGDEQVIAGTRNVVEEASLFGEATLALTPRLFASAGARIAYDRSVGGERDAPESSESRRQAVSALPSAGVLWKSGGRLSVYGRYEEGYRSGGLSVQSSGARRFEADRVATGEAGVRRGGPADRLMLSATVSFAHWADIQADLVDAAGLPYTDNIGSGRVLGLELESRWRPQSDLTVSGALLLYDSRLSAPAPGFTGEKDASLPNIADLVARGSVGWHVRVLGRAVDLAGSLAYVGRSRLGVGTALDLGQGGYLDTALGVSAPLGRFTWSLDVTNLADARGNMFSLGDPFGVVAGRQITPLRPRTIRLGVTTRF